MVLINQITIDHFYLHFKIFFLVLFQFSLVLEQIINMLIIA